MSSYPEEQVSVELAGHVALAVGTIFAALREGAAEAAGLWRELAIDGRLGPADLGRLRPGIESRLGRYRHFGGTGLAVDPDVLRDAERYQEWWLPCGDGSFEFLDLELDAQADDPYDYTTMSWFTGVKGGDDSVRGPYLDLAGSGLYVLTFAVPVVADRVFIGAYGADVPHVGIRISRTFRVRDDEGRNHRREPRRQSGGVQLPRLLIR